MQGTSECVRRQVVPSDKGGTGRAGAILFYIGWREGISDKGAKRS